MWCCNQIKSNNTASCASSACYNFFIEFWTAFSHISCDNHAFSVKKRCSSLSYKECEIAIYFFWIYSSHIICLKWITDNSHLIRTLLSSVLLYCYFRILDIKSFAVVPILLLLARVLHYCEHLAKHHRKHSLKVLLFVLV